MKKSTYIMLVVAWLAMGTSCTKFSDDINKNPNLPTKASNAQLLTYAINRIPAAIESPTGILYAQHWSEKPYTDDSRYTVLNFDFYGIYSGALTNLKTILDTKEFNVNDGSKANQLAVARILRAWFYWHMTDRWGDIPYKDALQGLANFTPAYTKQQEIYTDLFKELKEAAAQIDNGNKVAGDILFKGDMDKWRRFANSIRMLMGLRLSKVDAAKGKAEFADALAGGVIDNNSDNAVYVHLADETNESYWAYVFFTQERQWYWAGKTLLDYMKPLNDPRIKTFADPATNGGYHGVPYGLDGNAVGQIPSASVSLTGIHVRTQNSPCYVITNAQLLFAIAEAAKLNWIAGGDVVAAEKYTAAIEASVRQWNRLSFNAYDPGQDPQKEDANYDAKDQGDITGLAAYLAQPAIAYNAAGALKQIGYQRWVHLYMNGYEAWAEWRRTGYPELAPAPNNGAVQIPRRQGYPVKEQNINNEHYKAAISAQPGLNGKDDLTGRMWWDKP